MRNELSGESGEVMSRFVKELQTQLETLQLLPRYTLARSPTPPSLL